jgi:hypothetical protein
MTRSTFLLVACAAALLLLPHEAAAQFETPNRSFHESSAFRLEGRHASLPCTSCHLNGQYEGTPTTCYACHWVRRKDDRYQTRLGTQCEQCHRPTAWKAVRWDHSTATGTALNASHRVVTCVGCHQGGNFANAMIGCVSCHKRDFDSTRSPNHAAAGFPMNCDACHRPSDSTWRTGAGGEFNHNAIFPLQGTHATTACASCHKNNVYRGTPRDCVGCHQASYTATQNPNHAAAGFPTTCDSCHRPSDPGWRGTASFSHNAVFPLQGVHATVACASCHRNNVFKGTARDCVGCHQADYSRTQNPNHAAAGFPTTCDSCHRATDPAWRGTASFSHNAVFPLQGVHATVACTTCHRNNVFKGTARDCVGCHQDDYSRAQNPNHIAAAFPTSCDSCHRATDTQWRGASFNHTAFFPLVGLHSTQACATCHVNNVYRGTARTCVGCHQPQYNATRNPNHAAAGFPTTCESCHRATDTSWTQAQFSHTWFPLTGPHNKPCAQCHTTPNVYVQFSCTVCHARGETDSHHQSIAAYRYDSNACFACHPNGRH